MSPRTWCVASLAAALFGAGYAAGTCGRPTSAAVAVAETGRREAVAEARQAEQALGVIMLQENTLIEVLVAEVDTLRSQVAAARRRSPVVIDRIVEREAPEDTVVARRVAEAVRDSMEAHEIRPRDLIIEAQAEIIASKDRQLASTLALADARAAALEAALVEINALRGERPNWIPKLLAVGGPALGWWLRGALDP